MIDTTTNQNPPVGTIDVSVEAGIARVLINHPPRKNALTLAMRVSLASQLESLAGDPAVRVVILAGAGKDFCSGADVSEFGSNDISSTAARARLIYRAIIALAQMDKPVIAAVRGAAVGAGWSLALACDLILATDTARFGQVFRRLGLAPDAGSAYFLTRLLGPLKARELFFSGRTLSAQEVDALGLVNGLWSEDAFDTAVTELAGELATAPTLALGSAKRMVRLGQSPGLEEFLDLEQQMQSLLIRSEDHQEGLRAFREKQSPQFRGR